MEGVFELIGKGTTPEEKYTNAREAYNVLFDLMTTMSKLGVDAAGGDGALKYEKAKNGNIVVEAYPKGSWREWTLDEAGEGSWKTITDQPITLEFKDLAEANAFFDKIKKNVALLEPVLGSFAPLNNESAVTQKSLVYQNGEVVESGLRLLTDNEGSLNASGLIKSGSADYRYFIDTVENPNYFKTEDWQNVSKYLSKEIAFSLGKEIFTKSMQNKMQQARHKQQTEDYKEKKEEYEEGEYDKIKDEMKRENDQKSVRLKEEKELEKKKENERKQIEEADRKRVEAQRDKENQERAAASAKKSSSDKG